ncbi:MAG: hypothetical protein ACLROE_01670 [Collinsella intestinalis]
MSEKNTNVTETVEVDQAMGVMPEEVDPGMSVMPGPGVADTPTVIPELDSMLAVVLDQLPAYTTTDWKNKPSTATPVTAEIMKKIEQRLVDLTSAYNNQAAEIKALRDSVSRIGASKIQNILFRESMNNSEDVIFDVTMSDGTVTALGFSSNKFTYTNEKKSLKGGVALS